MHKFEKITERNFPQGNSNSLLTSQRLHVSYYKYIIKLKEILPNKLNGSIKILHVRVTYRVAVTKCPIKAIRKGFFFFFSQFKGQTITMGRSWQQEAEASGHIASPSMAAAAVPSFLFSLTLKHRWCCLNVECVGSVNTPYKTLHKHAHRFVPVMTLNPFKLETMTEHHTLPHRREYQ